MFLEGQCILFSSYLRQFQQKPLPALALDLHPKGEHPCTANSRTGAGQLLCEVLPRPWMDKTVFSSTSSTFWKAHRSSLLLLALQGEQAPTVVGVQSVEDIFSRTSSCSAIQQKHHFPFSRSYREMR